MQRTESNQKNQHEITKSLTSKDYSRAISLCLEIRDSNLSTLQSPDSTIYFSEVSLIQAYLGLGLYDTSYEECEYALRLFPEDPTLESLKGKSLFFLNNLSESLKTLTKVLRKDPSNSMAQKAIQDIQRVKSIHQQELLNYFKLKIESQVETSYGKSIIKIGIAGVLGCFLAAGVLYVIKKRPFNLKFKT